MSKEIVCLDCLEPTNSLVAVKYQKGSNKPYWVFVGKDHISCYREARRMRNIISQSVTVYPNPNMVKYNKRLSEILANKEKAEKQSVMVEEQNNKRNELLLTYLKKQFPHSWEIRAKAMKIKEK